MNYQNISSEGIKSLHEKAINIFSSPEDYTLEDMDFVLHEIDELLKTYHEHTYPNDVLWLSSQAL